MTMAFFGKSILVEKNEALIASMISDYDLIQKYPLSVCKTMVEGLSIARKTKFNVRIVYISETILDTESLASIKTFMEEKPDIHVILLKATLEGHSFRSTVNIECFKKVLFSPKSYRELIDYCVTIFEAKNDWNNCKPTAEEKFTEIDAIENTYIGTPIAEFVLTPKSFFNIYIKIGVNKFIKIINAGDEVTIEFIGRYTEKGVKELYITESEHNKYLAYSSKITDRIVSNDSTATDLKVRATLKFGKSIAHNLSQLGINAEKLDIADEFLNQSVKVVKSLRSKNKGLSSFLDMLDSNEHVSTVAFMSSLIANDLGFESTKAIKHIGIGALLHDIGLFQLRPNFKEVNIEDLNPDDLIVFNQHARYGADFLRSLKTIDETVCIMVEQHHLRRRSNDQSLRSSHINIATEILAVADDFFTSVIEGGINPDKVHLFREVNLKNFSPNIEKCLSGMLNGKKNQ